MVSYISRGTYTFDNKYVLNASLRVDGSSKFGANNKYGYFPAVSVAWRASEEEFIKKFDFISNLRVRRVIIRFPLINLYPSWKTIRW